jgi:hypothetical protein
MKRVALVMAAALAAACGGSSTSPSVVTPPTTVTTETFTGVVPVGGLKIHTFTVTAPGTISVTMTAAGPPPTITMGLGLGNPDASGNCILIATNPSAIASTTTPHLSGTLTSSGAYCVEIVDVGNAAGPITYSIAVSHT